MSIWIDMKLLNTKGRVEPLFEDHSESSTLRSIQKWYLRRTGQWSGSHLHRNRKERVQKKRGSLHPPHYHHHHHHHHHRQSLHGEGQWGTTDDFASSLLHFSLFSTALWDLLNSMPVIPWCCLPTSSSVCLVFFPLSLCLARWFWPDLMNGKRDHTTAVCVSLWSSGGLRVVLLPAGSWHRLPFW